MLQDATHVSAATTHFSTDVVASDDGSGEAGHDAADAGSPVRFFKNTATDCSGALVDGPDVNNVFEGIPTVGAAATFTPT